MQKDNCYKKMSLKKSTKSKFLDEDYSDFMNDTPFLNDPPKNKKQPKRRVDAEKEDSNLIDQPTASKRNKMNKEEVCGESRQKILNVMSNQLESRKKINERLLKNYSEYLAHLEADHNALKENEQKFEHLAGAFMKCMQQATAAYKQKLNVFREIHTVFKKECEETEAAHRAEMDKLGDELEEDINNLKQKLVSETKRNGWETLRKSFMQAMQNDF